MFRRILGFVMLIVGVIGVLCCLFLAIAGLRLVSELEIVLDNNLDILLDSLDTVKETLLLTKTTIGQVNSGLETVEETADDLAQTVNNTRPLIDQLSVVAAETVPDSIESVQATIPTVAAVAGSIDQTLRLLSAFKLEQNIFGIPIGFDLGVDYDPEEPFDQTIETIGASLDGLPGQLRSLKVYLAVTNDNLQTISLGIGNIADDLQTINGSVADMAPLLDDYIGLVTRTGDSLRQVRDDLGRQLGWLRVGIVGGAVWLALLHLPLLYTGREVLTAPKTNRGVQAENN